VLKISIIKINTALHYTNSMVAIIYGFNWINIHVKISSSKTTNILIYKFNILVGAAVDKFQSVNG